MLQLTHWRNSVKALGIRLGVVVVVVLATVAAVAPTTDKPCPRRENLLVRVVGCSSPKTSTATITDLSTDRQYVIPACKKPTEVRIDEILTMADREAATIELAKIYLEATDVARRSIAQSWPYGTDWSFPNWRQLPCQKNMQYSSYDRCSTLLLAFSFDRETAKYIIVDLRDALCYIADIYWGARLSGIDADTLFRRIAEASSTEANAMLLDFVRRDEKEKSMEAFGISAQHNHNGEIELQSVLDSR